VAGARHFTELIIWQLADELREHVFELTKKRPFATDFKLRSQLDDASDSVCRNIAEGFGCKSDKEFAKFVRIGRRSLNEVQDCFRSALLKRYVVVSDLVPARRLMRRLYPAISSFLGTLDP
jgi:four helix bundle protein